MANFNISYKFVAIDKFSKVSKKIGKTMGKMALSAKALAASLLSVGGAVAAMATAGVGLGMMKVAQISSNLSDALEDVRRVTNATDPELRGLKKTFIEMSKATGATSLELAQIAFEGAKIGVQIPQLKSYVDMVMKTAEAFGMVKSEAGETIGKIKNMMKLSFAETGVLLDQINYLADSTNANGARMIEIIQRTSGNLKALNMPSSVVAGWAAFSDQIETTPQLAASGIRMMTRSMMKMPGMMEKMISKPSDAIESYLKKIANLGEVQRAKYIFQEFGDEAGNFVLKAVGNMGLLREAMDKAMGKDALGSRGREWSNYMDRASTKVKRLRAIASAGFVAIGDRMTEVFVKVFPKLMELTGKFEEWAVSITDADVKRWGDGVWRVVEGLAMAADLMIKIDKMMSVDTVKGTAAQSMIKGALEFPTMKGNDVNMKIEVTGNLADTANVTGKATNGRLNIGRSMMATDA